MKLGTLTTPEFKKISAFISKKAGKNNNADNTFGLFFNLVNDKTNTKKDFAMVLRELYEDYSEFRNLFDYSAEEETTILLAFKDTNLKEQIENKIYQNLLTVNFDFLKYGDEAERKKKKAKYLGTYIFKNTSIITGKNLPAVRILFTIEEYEGYDYEEKIPEDVYIHETGNTSSNRLTMVAELPGSKYDIPNAIDFLESVFTSFKKR